MQPPEGDPATSPASSARSIRRPVSPSRSSTRTPDPDDVENLVELSFRDLGESTEVLSTQQPFKTEPRLELHRSGWTDTPDRLEHYIRKEHP